MSKVDLNHKYNHKRSPQKRLSQGDILGQTNFFTGLGEQYSARSKGFTKIIKIDRQNFINIIKKNESDYEKFCQIKDSILLYQEYKDINLFCKVCNLTTHQALDCSLVHFNKQRSNKIIGAKQSLKQNRSIIRRSTKNKRKSIKMVKELLFTVKYLRDTYTQNTFSIDQFGKIEYSSDENTGSSSSYDDRESFGEENDTINMNTNYQPSYKSLNEPMKTLEELITVKSNINNESIIQIPLGHSEIQKRQSIQIKQQTKNDMEIDDTHQDTFKQQLKELKEVSDFNHTNSLSDYISKQIQPETKEVNKNSKRDVLENSKYFDYPKDINDKEVGYKAIHKQNKKPQSSLKGTHLVISNDIDDQKSKMPSQKEIRRQKRGMTRKNDINKLYGTSSIVDRRITHFNSSQYYKFQQLISKFNPTQELFRFNPWDFELLKDYKFYFPNGNSKIQIQKHARYMKRKVKEQLRKKTKK